MVEKPNTNAGRSSYCRTVVRQIGTGAMLKLLRLGMVLHSKLSHLATLLPSGTPVCSLVVSLSGGSAWTCCFGEDPGGRPSLLRHTV